MSTVDSADAFLETFLEMKRAVYRTAWRIFAPLDLGPTQVKLMRELSRHGAVAQGALARATTSDPAATSRAVQSLVDIGWVRRTPSEEDRRALRVETTAAGKKAMKRIDAAYAALAKALVTGLAPRDRSHFQRIARKVVAQEVLADMPTPKKKSRRPQ